MSRIPHVELHVPAHVDLTPVARVFPWVPFLRADRPRPGSFDGSTWRSEGFDFWAFDRALDEIAMQVGTLAISVARDAATIIRELLTRAQRILPRSAGASATPWFRRVLELHRARHDLDKPRIRADFDHAIDTWQWTLRLDPAPAGDVQLAALCHDIDRLESELDAGLEHLAPDYQVFKNAHAEEAARRARVLFDAAGVPPSVAASAVSLIARHERPTGDLAVQAVNDADALSFFSFNSFGYLRSYGSELTERKTICSFDRMSPLARRELPALRLPATVRAQLATGGVISTTQRNPICT